MYHVKKNYKVSDANCNSTNLRNTRLNETKTATGSLQIGINLLPTIPVIDEILDNNIIETTATEVTAQ